MVPAVAVRQPRRAGGRYARGLLVSPTLIVQLLLLLTVANGTPVIAKRILGDRLAAPVDWGLRFTDGRPVFGPSKTLRGLVLSVAATLACAPLLGLEWKVGAVIGAGAMSGDLLASFLKRRLDLPPSSQALGLDQVPESLLPLLACRLLLPLSILDIVAATTIFFVGELMLSRILFRLHIRDRPF